jgi:hypothetical protein
LGIVQPHRENESPNRILLVLDLDLCSSCLHQMYGVWRSSRPVLKSCLSADQQELSTGPESLIVCSMSGLDLGLRLSLPCPRLRQADQMLTICVGMQGLLTKSHSTWWARPA